MKNVFTKILACGILLLASGPRLLAAPENGTDRDQIRRTEEAIEAFYTAYCQNMADGRDDESLLDHHLTQSLVKKVRAVREKNGYDPIVRAQDFDRKALATLTVTHVDADWYAVGYLDGYNCKCVIVPVRVRSAGGSIRIDDIAVD